MTTNVGPGREAPPRAGAPVTPPRGIHRETRPEDLVRFRAQLTRRRAGHRDSRKPTALLLTADFVAFLTAAIVVGRAGIVATVTFLLVVVALFWTADLYRSRRLSLSVLDDVPVIVGRALAAGAVAMATAALVHQTATIAVLGTAVSFAVLSVLARAAAYAGIRAARRRGRLVKGALLLGAGTVAGRLAENLKAHPECGLRPQGMLDDDPLLTEDQSSVPLLGGYDALTATVLEHDIDVVIVTYGRLRESEMVGILRACDRLTCEILFVPRLYELHTVTKGTEVVWGIPVVRLRRAPFRTGAWTGKRLFDVALSAAALFVLAPVMGLVAALVRWDTGQVLFRQTRVGLDGAEFTLLKFCTLRPAGDAESSTRWNIAEDGRLRPIGRLLRRTSLDELPQLWNVLRGDMSLVGPRPERPFFVAEFARRYPWYTARHRVPAGLTGWAQVHGLRGDTSIADRARFDNSYIENWSMWGDVKILLRTVGQVIGGGGR